MRGHRQRRATLKSPETSRRYVSAVLVAVGAAALALLTMTGSTASAVGGTTQPPRVTFVEASENAGLHFDHVHGGTGRRYMVETMGSGVSVADLDGDGWLDVYFVQSAATPEFQSPQALHNVFYRNRGNGTFVAASRISRLDDPGYGMGSAAADYDNDGFTDLYVTNFGANRLYRNNGDGTFSDVTGEAGVGDEGWGTSAAWADIDDDGNLDLYVANYVDFTWENHKFCGSAQRNLRAYCHPDVYGGVADVLYRNQGDGTFADVAAAAGVANAREGKGLGVVFGDYDNDGDLDTYVANDSTRNFLYLNQGDGTFFDNALLAGVGYNQDGKAEAGMGTDSADFDGDGRLDIVVTNLDLQTNTLYQNLGQGIFSDVTFATGLAEPSLLYVGFGINWFDYDNDADFDLFVANGHIIDNVESFRDNVTYAQPNHLYRNEGANFEEVHQAMGPGFEPLKVSRGSSIGDLDNDGDIDVIVTNNNQSADYLRNDGGNRAGHWIQLRLVGRTANRTAAGARVLVIPLSSGSTPGAAARELPILVEVKAGSSYSSSSDLQLHIGLGAAAEALLTIHWPGGRVERLGRLAGNRAYVLHEARGVIAQRGPTSQ